MRKVNKKLGGRACNEKSTAELYEDLIAPAVFERSSSKVIDGYTVESGNLLMPDKTVGSLVTVRSGSGV